MAGIPRHAIRPAYGRASPGRDQRHHPCKGESVCRQATTSWQYGQEGLYANRMVALARLVPSLRSLLIFESVARSGSCSAAAREFNLTQPSASRNIAQLEAHLGVPLFTRSASGMELTREGQMLYQALGDGFHRVEAALQDLSALRHRNDV